MEDLHGRKIIIEETERSIQTKLVYLPTMPVSYTHLTLPTTPYV